MAFYVFYVASEARFAFAGDVCYEVVERLVAVDAFA